jgi:hypothetical protein
MEADLVDEVFNSQFATFQDDLNDSIKSRSDYKGLMEAVKAVVSPPVYTPSPILLLFLDKFPEIIRGIQEKDPCFADLNLLILY